MLRNVVLVLAEPGTATSPPEVVWTTAAPDRDEGGLRHSPLDATDTPHGISSRRA